MFNMTEQEDISKIDTLNRDTYIQNIKHVIEVLKKNGNGGSFAISAGWGYGKTFILEKLESELSSNKDFYILRYDCWKYNYYEEPLMALLASMVDQLQDVDYIREVLKTTVKALGYILGESILAIGSAVSKKAFNGVDLVEAERKAYNNIKNDLNDFSLPDYDKNSSLRKSIDIMREVLGKVAAEKQMILVIDELDRCLPAYQIKIFERIHHLMDKQTSITIYAINPEQLRETIRQIYGGDSEERTTAYLKKYMDFQIPLPIGDLKNHVYERYKKHFIDFQEIPIGKESDECFDVIIKMFSECDARTINKIWEKQYLLHHIVYDGMKNDVKPSYKMIFVELMVLVMLQWQKKVYNDSISIGLYNTTTVSPEMLVCSPGFVQKESGKRKIQSIIGLWQLWKNIAASLNYKSFISSKEGERTIIHLSKNELSLLEYIGIYWCNVSDNKYLKYKMETESEWESVSEYYVEQFNASCQFIGEFYKLACIIE